MELGFSTMNTLDDVPPGELGPALEARGYESLWMGEHSHIPVSRRTPYPAGGEMPEQYAHMGDPFISLTVAAVSTDRLRVGTNVSLPLEHDLFAFAKTVATLDQASGGRLQLGVGVGWNEEELADHTPIPWRQRYRALAECVEALRALWGDEESEHHGRFFEFDAVWSFPKPHQRPHPPLLLGASGPLGQAHAIEWADGWAPMDAGLGDVPKRVERFRQACTEAGREPLPITIVTFGDPSPDALRAYRDLGIERAILGAAREGWADPGTTYPFIDRYAALVDDLAG
jgi:probable F420-dependent oxidoreductase